MICVVFRSRHLELSILESYFMLQGPWEIQNLSWLEIAIGSGVIKGESRFCE